MVELPTCSSTGRFIRGKSSAPRRKTATTQWLLEGSGGAPVTRSARAFCRDAARISELQARQQGPTYLCRQLRGGSLRGIGNPALGAFEEASHEIQGTCRHRFGPRPRPWISGRVARNGLEDRSRLQG